MSSLKDYVAQAQKKKKSGAGGARGGKRQWKRRGDIAAEKRRRTEAERKRKEVELLSSLEVYLPKDELDEMEAAEEDVATEARLPVADVKARLRERSEPITLFGESDLQREQRLQRVEENVDESTVGQTNVFNELMDELGMGEDRVGMDPALQALVDLVPDVNAAATAAKTNGGDGDGAGVDKDQGTDGEGDKGVDNKDADGDNDAGHKEDTQQQLQLEDEIARFFLDIILEWQKELESMSDAQRRKRVGKEAQARWKQTCLYILPLYQRLHERSLSLDLLSAFEKIMNLLRQREYMQAYHVYNEMSIGNAPWPMGVTMVGIHARAGRERINEGQHAHVLNDEVQRKYITVTKRLMSYYQRLHPNVPSKSIG